MTTPLNWHNHILKHFTDPIHNLTLVADPDGLLLDENILAIIRQRGFELHTFSDPIAFRYLYEAHYRQYWDDNRQTKLVVVLRSAQPSLKTLAYDLLQTGRSLTFKLPDMFPKLSYPILKTVPLNRLSPLYQASQTYYGATLNNQDTSLFILKHAYILVPDLIKSPLDFLKWLLAHYIHKEPLSPPLAEVVTKALSNNLILATWPLNNLLTNYNAFLAFLQQAWQQLISDCLNQPQATTPNQIQQTTTAYYQTPRLPLNNPHLTPYLQTLFLEGNLNAISVPPQAILPLWSKPGIIKANQPQTEASFTKLLPHLKQNIPSTQAPYKQWLNFATVWAKSLLTRYNSSQPINNAIKEQFKHLHHNIQIQFKQWMFNRYHTLANQPYLPQPVMVHHIPNYLAHYHQQHPKQRLALLVLDGLTLAEWLIIKHTWQQQNQAWHIKESQLFAWVPTLTAISRQALFAGLMPHHFPTSWQTTATEKAHWLRFWAEYNLSSTAVAYLRNLGSAIPLGSTIPLGSAIPLGNTSSSIALETELTTVLSDHRVQIVGLIINQIDNIAHGMQLGTMGIYQQLNLWLKQYPYLTTLIKHLLAHQFTIFLSSDHGHVWAQGIGRPNEGVLAETRGQRARLYKQARFVKMAHQQIPQALIWNNIGLPQDLNVLLAPSLTAFLEKGQQAISHGGIALEEVIVPFAKITPKD